MKLKIISQSKAVYEGEVKSIQLPSKQGEMGILPGHINLTSLLEIGTIKVIDQFDKEKIFAINGGIVDIKGDNVLILANEAVLSDELMKQEIDEAIKKAEEKLASKLEPTELIQLEKQIRYEKIKRKIKDSLR